MTKGQTQLLEVQRRRAEDAYRAYEAVVAYVRNLEARLGVVQTEVKPRADAEPMLCARCFAEVRADNPDEVAP